MNRKSLLALVVASLVLALPRAARADSQWVLEQSTLTYHVTHPLHEVDGTSHEARGKGVCHAGQCEFLIAVPVKSFDSGDTNRDLHTLQVVRGGEFPMVVVRTQLPESATTASTTIHADLEIQFAGQKVEYKQVPLKLEIQGGETKISGTIPAKVSDFKIDPPKLLTIPIKNDIPVDVVMTWRRM
jgi:YceI-like domain